MVATKKTEKLSVSDWLGMARMLATDRMPYLSSAVYFLMPREQPGLGTMAVTAKGVMYYDPVLASQWTYAQAAAVILHECLHHVREHAERATDAGVTNLKKWNMAGDLEINDDLELAKLKLPGDYLSPKKLHLEEGLLAEEYYQLLPDPPESEGEGEEKPSVGSGKCGGCSGNPDPEEQEVEGGEDGSQAPDGRTPIETELMRDAVAEAIRQESTKNRGTVPASLVRWAEEHLRPPKIPWREKLAVLTRNAIAYRPGAIDNTFTKPSRRQGGIGYGPGKPILAAWRAPIPRVWVIVDTSGSMGGEALTTALVEIQGILDASGAQVTICACDAQVHTLQTVRHVEEARALLVGGGGTDFRPAFEQCEKAQPRPEVVVFVTDGFGPAPASPPMGMEVIWALVGKGAKSPAPWGSAVEIDP